MKKKVFEKITKPMIIIAVLILYISSVSVLIINQYNEELDDFHDTVNIIADEIDCFLDSNDVRFDNEERNKIINSFFKASENEYMTNGYSPKYFYVEDGALKKSNICISSLGEYCVFFDECLDLYSIDKLAKMRYEGEIFITEMYYYISNDAVIPTEITFTPVKNRLNYEYGIEVEERKDKYEDSLTCTNMNANNLDAKDIRHFSFKEEGRACLCMDFDEEDIDYCRYIRRFAEESGGIFIL